MTTRRTARPPAPSSALGRAFHLVWWAAALSGLGDGLVLAAFPLLAADLTDDPRLIVGVTVAARLPWLLLALPAGVVVDRGDQRRLLVRVEVARTTLLVAFGVLVALGFASLPLVFAVVFCIGAGQCVFVASSHALLPAIVAGPNLARANGYLLAADTATENTVGPAVGGALFAVALALPFFLDGLSYALSALLLLLGLPVLGQGARARRDGGGAGAGLAAVPAPSAPSLRAELAEGWRYFRRDPLLRDLAGLVAVFAWCQALVLGPLVLFALDDLGLSGGGYGLLVGVAALGNVVGGVAAGRLDRRLGAAVLVPVAGAVAGVAYLGAAGAPGAVLAAVALLVEGAAVSVGNAANLAVRQRIIPGALLGRVGNIFRFFIYGVMPVGALVGGVVAEGIGLRAPFVVAALVQLVAVAVLGPRFARALRRREPAP